MLKKLSGKTTRVLFYIKNNFLGLTFKLSVLTTLSILIYLVCVLKQTNLERSSDHNEVRSIENSQKLMLTMPTEISSNGDSQTTMTTASTKLDNFISKTSDYTGDYPLFHLSQQTTTSVPIHHQATAPSTDQKITDDTTIAYIKISTTSYHDAPTTSGTATETFKQESTLRSDYAKAQAAGEEPVPSTLIISATQSVSQNATEMPIDTSQIPASIFPITTSNPLPPNTKTDDLFMDNWSNSITASYDEDQAYQSDETSPLPRYLREPTENLFLNEDGSSSSVEDSLQKNKTDDQLSPHEEVEIPSFGENLNHDDEGHDMDQEPQEAEMINLESPPVLPPNSLLNLFTLDHLPSASNMRNIWRTLPKNAPFPRSGKTASVKNLKGHSNQIAQVEELEEDHTLPNAFNQMNQFQEMDTLFNRKLKESVSFLERLFANLVV